MTVTIHTLNGCTPRPLGSYLKAVGVLRLIAGQADPSARGWWEGEAFHVATERSLEEFERFFLERYSPTPTVSPWNKGSGFYTKVEALKAIEASSAPRLESYRRAIADARSMLQELQEADLAVRAIKEQANKLRSRAEKERLRSNPEYKKRLAAADRRFKAIKEGLLPRLRLMWRGPHLDWMECALTVTSDGSPQYPPMLGVGGGDGRFDFTNNFMQRLGELFDVADPLGRPRLHAAVWLKGALFGDPIPGLEDVSIGQFAPGSAGGANSSNGPVGSPSVNPWDLVLALEGAVLFAASATRRLSAEAPGAMSTPFMVRSHAAGYASASAIEDAPRGEQWMPLWSRPISIDELRLLLAEGRAQLDKRVARQPLEIARAVSRLGVARGLTAFERYSYLERNGQSNLAVPLGRIEVVARPHAAMLDDVAEWLDRLRREARANTAPARLRAAERRLADAAFEAVAHDRTPERWQAVLLAMAEVERLIAQGSALRAGPIPLLGPEWIDLADDGSSEIRLAKALGLASALALHGKRRVDPVRHHWLPLDASGRRLQVRDGKLASDSRVVAHGQDPIADLIAVVTRRFIEAEATGRAQGRSAWVAPLVAERGASTELADLGAFLRGDLDTERILGLSRAFMAVDRRRWRARPLARAAKHTDPRDVPDEGWLCIRAAASPWALVQGGEPPPIDLALIQRLASGDVTAAVSMALRRLRALGVAAPIRFAAADPDQARRWAAALIFPISPVTARRIAGRLNPDHQKELTHVC